MQYYLMEDSLDLSELLVQVSRSEHIFLKFLTPNDLGLTGSHQAGLYIGQEGWPLFLREPGKAGENLERDISLHWHDGRITKGSFKWYGRSKSEYRLTRVMSFFRDRSEHHSGSLLILYGDPGRINAALIDREEEIGSVLDFFGITPAQTGGVIRFDLEERLSPEFEDIRNGARGKFPDTEYLARKSQEIFRKLYGSGATNPDSMILRLIEIEYALFRALEKEFYGDHLKEPFRSVDELLSVSLEINNRRKSRAGKSLELHLRYVFQTFHVPFSHGETTKEEKRPDFIFPGIDEYHDGEFPDSRLFFLGAKTTCKDRWRQILNEADRTPRKHLFTLQQGISSAQLREMEQAGVVPVIPKEYHDRCRARDQKYLMALSEFIDLVLDANGRELSLFS